jgi:hypothetical protein
MLHVLNNDAITLYNSNRGIERKIEKKDEAKEKWRRTTKNSKSE